MRHFVYFSGNTNRNGLDNKKIIALELLQRSKIPLDRYVVFENDFILPSDCVAEDDQSIAIAFWELNRKNCWKLLTMVRDMKLRDCSSLANSHASQGEHCLQFRDLLIWFLSSWLFFLHNCLGMIMLANAHLVFRPPAFLLFLSAPIRCLMTWTTRRGSIWTSLVCTALAPVYLKVLFME